MMGSVLIRIRIPVATKITPLYLKNSPVRENGRESIEFEQTQKPKFTTYRKKKRKKNRQLVVVEVS